MTGAAFDGGRALCSVCAVVLSRSMCRETLVVVVVLAFSSAACVPNNRRCAWPALLSLMLGGTPMASIAYANTLWCLCLLSSLCSSYTNRLITAKDHAAVQINVGHVDAAGVFNGRYSAFVLSGNLRVRGEADRKAHV